jgi:3-oxoadipate enol-lactonase
MTKVHANGIDICYEISGNGPTVTLSHSLSTDLTMWDELATALANRFTVLRYDTRGHGGSSAPAGAYGFAQLAGDVAGLLDTLGIERTHFVGLSMGGMIAQYFALACPQRLERLVIASSSSRTPPQAAALWDERIAVARAQGMRAHVEPTLGRWFTAGYRAAHPEVMARIGRLIEATPVAGYAGCGEAIRRLDLTQRLGAIRAPALVIVGADDPGTPPAMSEAIAGAVPGARLQVIPAASHLCCIEQAQAFNRLVLDFLA